MDGIEIAKMVLEFLEKTGVALVETGFPIAMKYVIADGVLRIVKGLGFGTLFLYSLNQLDGNEIAYVWFILSCVSFGLMLASGFFEGIKMLMAPEWYAIMNIVKIVGG